MKIFVVMPHKFAGCGFYRQYQPHNHLAKQGIDVLIGAGLYKEDDTFSCDADIVQFHKGYFDQDAVEECKRRGMITIGDFDDWWRLDTEHLFYKQYLDDDITQKLVAFLRAVDYVTVTTELLANEVRKINPNVVVLPNAMDMNYDSCKEEKKTDMMTFAYIGGHCHGKDVELLRGVTNRLRGDYKFRLMGYDGSDVYNHYADVLSDSGRKVSHFDHVPKVDIWNYHKLYNYMDVSLVPLVDNKFNSLKSELKLIEAGFFGKAVIVSNVEPYKGLLKHGVNCLAVNKPRDWVKHCQMLIDNPQMAEDLGEGLRETVQPYSIEEVNKKRLNFYKDVLKKRDTNGSDRHSRLQGVHGC
jgi:glycosyltransferase involved in cell wall biosynthesis